MAVFPFPTPRYFRLGIIDCYSVSEWIESKHCERVDKMANAGGSGFIRLLLMSILLKRLSEFPFFSSRRRARFARSSDKRRRRLSGLLIEESPVVVPTDRQPTAFGTVHLETGSDTGVETDIDPTNAVRRILVVCTHAPTIKHAGGLRIVDMLHKIRAKTPNAYIELFTSDNFKLYGPLGEITQIVDTVVLADNYNFSLAEYLRKTPMRRYFDVIDFQFPQSPDVVRAYKSIGAKLIFTPMESYIRNECIDRNLASIRGAELTSPTAIEEAAICRLVDQTICVSEKDREAIANCVDVDVIAIETAVSDIEFSSIGEVPVTKNECAACFVAYFGSETNRDALRWLLAEVLPRVRCVLPDFELRIVGRGDVSDIVRNAPAGVRYIGEVERIAPEIEAAAVGIALALSGSGFRGKINQYARLGVPCVANTLAADGLAYVDGRSIVIADGAENFADAITTLLRDVEKRRRIGAAAADICRSTYGWEAKWPSIAEVYGLPLHPERLAMPRVHAVVPSYRHAPFIEERIRSIFQQEYPYIRVTVIDDHSEDGSHEIIERLRKEFNFTYIRRAVNSGTPFSAWKYAAENTSEELIWLCESDDYSDRMLVSKLVRAINRRPTTKVAYCASWVVDKDGRKLETTHNYASSVFHPTRWLKPFYARGEHELRQFQICGMVVPNMSSCLIDTAAFRAAFTGDIEKYKLAGDWLFLGHVMQFGDICYVPDCLNFFRRHNDTARAGTNTTRRNVEHIAVRLTLSELVGASKAEILNALRFDLRELCPDPSLAEAVCAEMQRLFPEREKQLRTLLREHCP